jgi:hypothetical protein
MSNISSPKPVKGIENKWFGRQLRTSNGFETHEALWKMLLMKSQENPSTCAPHYDWSSFGGVSSATFLHVNFCLAPMLEGGPR